jgi:hypothetical protein
MQADKSTPRGSARLRRPRTLIGAITAAAMFATGVGPSKALAATTCWMVTYTYGPGMVSFELIKRGEGADEGPTYMDIVQKAQENMRMLGRAEASVTPTGIFRVACGKTN